MTPIPEELIEQVRDAADIVHLVGEHVELRRTGSDYRGPCPFHGGTHRNFAVIPKKQLFYCFVCHEAGDVFKFFMKKQGLDYPGAVREVARRVGIAIPERPVGGPDPREPLFEAVAVAAEWYAGRLREASDADPARRYLADRGFALEALLPLGLGYAPRGDAFLAAMRTLGIGEAILLDAGLAVRREDGAMRPRFWGRLLFPIHDLRGRAVGFGGRLLGEGEPKYLNSPESPVFHKGRLLYNLHHAKPAIRRAERALVVEGYFDALRLVEAGLEHAVAPLGTALTPEQAQLLRRFTGDATLLYDSDRAGLRATFRAGDELLRAGLRVSVATLPPGEDPDTLARAGGREAVERVLDDAIDVYERKIQLLERKGWLASLSGRRRALDRLLPTLRAPRDPVTRDLYVARTAEALGISRESVEREAQRPAPPPAAARAARGGERPMAYRPGPRPERDLLRVMLREPDWRSRIGALLSGQSGLLEPEGGLIARLARSPGVGGAELLAEVDGEARMVVSDLLDRPWGAINVDALVEGALRRLQSRPLESQVAQLQREVAFAPDPEKAELTRRIASLRDEISRLNTGRWNVIRQGRSSAF